MLWFVYIAQTPTGKYYTGITTDPRRRIQDHNRDEGAKFAHDQGALRLLYTSPAFSINHLQDCVKSKSRVGREKRKKS